MRHFMAMISMLGLAACSGGAGAPDRLNFGPGDLSPPVITGNEGRLPLRQGGILFAAEVIPDQGGSATYNLLSDTVVFPQPVTGGATMTGYFGLGRVTNIEKQGDINTGTAELFSGNITVSANFVDRTLVGGGDGLAINGTTSGNMLGGQVTFGSLTAPLTGTVGDAGAIGVFETVNTAQKSVMAGGFIAATP